jgi:hypothetical protein
MKRPTYKSRMIKHFLFGLGLATASVFIESFQPVSALCLTSNAENNCSTFSGSSLSQVIQTYDSLNLTTNAYFQIGFRSSNGAAYTINNLAYSTNGSSYTSFTGSISTSGAFQYASIQNPFSTGSLGRPFYVSYDIQPTVPDGVRIDSMFLANNTGTQTGGVLDFNGGNFEAIERTHQAVPAPLPVLGAAFVFSRVRHLKQKSKQLH